jgi:hypothetical protein
MRDFKDQRGKAGYIILWLLGVPASVLLLIFLLRGCT